MRKKNRNDAIIFGPLHRPQFVDEVRPCR